MELLEIVAALEILLPRFCDGCPAGHKIAFVRLLGQDGLDHGQVLGLQIRLLLLELCVRRPLRLPVALVPATPFLHIGRLVLFFLLQNVRFHGPDGRQEGFEALRVANVPGLGQVPAVPLLTLLPVQVKQQVKGPIPNVERWHVRQKVVPHQKGQKDKVVDDALQIMRTVAAKLQGQVLAQHRNVQQLKVGFFGEFFDRLEGLLGGEVEVEIDHLPQQAKVRLVRDKGQHDEIGILAVDAVAGVGRVQRRGPQLAQVLHDLVFSLAWDVVSTKDDGQLVPLLFELLADVILDDERHLFKELGPGGDAIAVKDVRPRRKLLVLRILGRAEAAAALLVELGPGRYPVNGHVNTLLGLDDGDDAVEVVHDPQHHVLFAQDFRDVEVARVRATVNDPVQVQVQVVHLGQQRLIGDDLVDLGITLRDPSIKLSAQEVRNRRDDESESY